MIAGSPLLGFAKPRTTTEGRSEHVYNELVPMFAYQTASQWRAGLMPPTILSIDKDRAKKLYDELSAVPRPTMLRYFLEVCTTDLTEELKNLNTPIMAVEALPPALIAAPASIRKKVLDRNAWVELEKVGLSVSVEFITNSQRFIMDDQPKTFDATIEQFVASVRAQ